MFEIIYAIILKLSIGATILSVFLALLSGGALIGGIVDNIPKAVSAGKYGLLFLLVILPIAFVPSPKDLLRVRLGMLKYNFASSVNVEKGVAELQRISKKLECKYLGGCNEK